ncbi:MAG: hypothetical protein CMI55_04780 [Parcubacteria group bacterium]|jgi:hypothetical protein|nr:hypothetical protein [Parcubacteria group bacterium]
MDTIYEYRFRLIIFILCAVLVYACGLSPVIAKEYSPVQAKLMAKRAARLDALRKLAELIYGTSIDSETTVNDMVVGSDRIRAGLKILIRGAVEVDYQYYDDLSAEVTMEVETGTITDILNTTIQYEGKTFRETGFGAPPDVDLIKTQAVISYKDKLAIKQDKASTGKTVSEDAGKDAHSPEMDKIEREQEQVVSEPPDLSTPTVSIISPGKKEMSVPGDHIRVKAKAISHDDNPITDIWIQVNGMRQKKDRGIGIMNKDSKEIDGSYAEIDVTVYLSEKNNQIEIIASNALGESEPGRVDVIWQGAGTGTGFSEGNIYKPDLYVLSIGVSEYEDKEYGLDLDYAHVDASAISDAFETQSGGLYKNVHNRLLTNSEANRINVLDGLNWILKESTQKDTTVIFVAGHGIKDVRGNYYFLPYDSNPKKPWENGVKWFDFQDTVSSLPSKVVFMVDTCHSGSVTGKRRGVVVDMTGILQQLINTGSGVVVLAASTGKESSQESKEWGHGAFTKALLEGLEGKADYDGNTVVSVKELDLYITKRVKEMTNGAQHPTTEIQKTLPDFPLALKR